MLGMYLRVGMSLYGGYASLWWVCLPWWVSHGGYPMVGYERFNAGYERCNAVMRGLSLFYVLFSSFCSLFLTCFCSLFRPFLHRFDQKCVDQAAENRGLVLLLLARVPEVYPIFLHFLTVLARKEEIRRVGMAC